MSDRPDISSSVSRIYGGDDRSEDRAIVGINWRRDQSRSDDEAESQKNFTREAGELPTRSRAPHVGRVIEDRRRLKADAGSDYRIAMIRPLSALDVLQLVFAARDEVGERLLDDGFDRLDRLGHHLQHLDVEDHLFERRRETAFHQTGTVIDQIGRSGAAISTFEVKAP
jgi:hypothetical protein